MSEADNELIVKLRRGDREAFGQLVDAHAQSLYRTAVSLLGNHADAEDVVQEALAGALISIKSFRGDASLKTWLTRILLRQVARFKRSSYVRRMFSLNRTVDEGGDVELPSASAKPGATERKLDVQEMLKTLSDEHRTVLVLRELQGMSYAEIAAALQVPQGTVESRIHRARQELKQRFEGYW